DIYSSARYSASRARLRSRWSRSTPDVRPIRPPAIASTMAAETGFSLPRNACAAIPSAPGPLMVEQPTSPLARITAAIVRFIFCNDLCDYSKHPVRTTDAHYIQKFGAGVAKAQIAVLFLRPLQRHCRFQPAK